MGAFRYGFLKEGRKIAGGEMSRPGVLVLVTLVAVLEWGKFDPLDVLREGVCD